MATLVIAEHSNTELKPATLHAVTAAQQLGADVHVLVAGAGCSAVVDAAARIAGVSKVLVADNAAYATQLAENTSALIAEVAAGYDAVLAAATAGAKNVMPRVAALLDVAQISEITAVISADTFERPIYAGNVIATVQSTDARKVITVRATGFDAAPAEGGSAAIEVVSSVHESGLSRFIDERVAKSDRPELTAARVVVSGGRGMQNGDNFKLLEAVADKLNAAVGASRAAVDAGFVPNDYQVGQTGKIVAPDLYIAVGISGAVQHLAGISNSSTVVAINVDGDADMFTRANYGVVGDYKEVLPGFVARAKEIRG